MALPTLADAKLPAVTLPLTVTASDPRAPTTVGVPDTVALKPVSYCLLIADNPLIVTGAGVMVLVVLAT